MKKFYYLVKEFSGRRANRQLRIYQLTKGELRFACESRRYSTAATPGDDAEALQALVANGFVSKKWLESSHTAWSGPGYYQGPVCEAVRICKIW